MLEILRKQLKILINRASFRESAALHCSRLSTVGHRRGGRAVACFSKYLCICDFVHCYLPVGQPCSCLLFMSIYCVFLIYCNHICNCMYFDVVKCAEFDIFVFVHCCICICMLLLVAFFISHFQYRSARGLQLLCNISLKINLCLY